MSVAPTQTTGHGNGAPPQRGRRARKPESAEEQHRRATIPTIAVGRKCFVMRPARNRTAVQSTRSEEQAARNEVRFREANERLGEKRHELDVGGRTPYLCECDNPTCTELIRLAVADYEQVRSHANWFLVATGHDGETRRHAGSHDGYEIVEKRGLAGRIAKEQNPRR